MTSFPFAWILGHLTTTLVGPLDQTLDTRTLVVGLRPGRGAEEKQEEQGRK